MKKIRFVLGVMVLFVSLLPQIVNAQTHKVTVVVVDSFGERVPGASILVCGTSDWATTDVNGVATLECPEKALLIISALGYKTTMAPVNGDITLLVVLEEDMAIAGEKAQSAAAMILPKEIMFDNPIFRS